MTLPNPLNSEPSPSYTQTISKTYTRKVEQKGPSKVTTRTTTCTKTLVLIEDQPQSTHRPPPSSSLDPADDSDDPNDDAQISFATDTEAEFSPSPTPDHLRSSAYYTARSQSPCPCPRPRPHPQRTRTPSVAPHRADSQPLPGTANTANDDDIIAYYEVRYPGRVPHPDFYNGCNTNCSDYYVVTAGKSVGIFTQWTVASDLVSGVRHAKHESYTEYYRAWLAYREQWASKNIRVLGTYQDSAPLSTQIADSGLESSLGNLTL
ncbi:hypothetical protein AAF712_014370 [Marasmius tenuissimus]|uniref:Ribonuclease H1 N-terminal domain-containing protein n=1 Tax=Marasmius tenuissimus TaxID=585030 RepID=A0ABR2ZCH8_9AGAR